ncbi:MAG: type I DNA topoisomerase [Thermoguttaceae bacterium]|nr:type I DNA topoisomerase [Thermoguttaceae bacterium]MDW8079260.1 type I DNA topoisomerase [Thermoguttaceae bacterium]
MAKAKRQDSGRSLVIVESPTKARTISGFLGPEFFVEASMGHVRDLPEGAKDVPPDYRKSGWAELGVNVEEDFKPLYVIPKEKQKHVTKLRRAVKDAARLYLATDEDREGEAISWHLCEVLKPEIERKQLPVHRLVFHEITKEAIQKALQSPRDINEDLVRAQEARRILDRLFGYGLSPLLWRKIRAGLSAGRVQSVALRLVVEREQQRMAFRPARYWDLTGLFQKQNDGQFEAKLILLEGKRLPEGRDFDPTTGQPKDPDLAILDEAAAKRWADELLRYPARVAEVEEKPYVARPAPPFITSTLQQEANRKFGFTARYTMQLAQSLYENGYITYMRTDSTHLAPVALEAARETIAALFGEEYLPPEPRVYRTRVRNAQEAHEAIRPAGHPFRSPEELRGVLPPDEWKLYELIWKRTIASQMRDAEGKRVTVQIAMGPARFHASGKTITFPGYLRAYVEGSDDPEAELADREVVIPPLVPEEEVVCQLLEPKGHTTQPPPRYTEATLIRTLEDMGIGRPSTYATILDTILSRNYVTKRGNALAPTWLGMAVTNLLKDHFPELVDYQFTAQMEEELDAISRGEANPVDYLRKFYFGNENRGLKELLEKKIGEIRADQVNRILIGQPKGEGPEAAPIYVRLGKYGPYLEQGDRRAPLPPELLPDELTVEKALELLRKAAEEDKPIGFCPQTNRPIYVKTGRFGPYVQLGNRRDGQKVRQVYLPRGTKREDVTLEQALEWLSFPKKVGVHPDNGKEVFVNIGRYGPYVQCDSETRSLPPELSPKTITLEQALELLAQPKTSRRTRRSPEPLRVFTLGENGERVIRVMDGRYGPYVTDGKTNATLPKDLSVDALTAEQAEELLRQRAAQQAGATGRRKRRARRST